MIRRAGARVAVAIGVAIVTGGVLSGKHQERRARGAAVPVYGYTIVNAFPHDAGAFTQGLVFRDGFLYESTGLNGRSSLRKVRLETGEVVQRRDVDRRHFAEGLTDWGNRLVQLTWSSNIGFVYDLASFEPVRTFGYRGQGWGLTHDGRRLIMSEARRSCGSWIP
jgi:glutaminyl-peptide cyclotransferase